MRFKMADIFSVSLLKSSKSSWRSWIPTMVMFVVCVGELQLYG